MRHKPSSVNKSCSVVTSSASFLARRRILPYTKISDQLVQHGLLPHWLSCQHDLGHVGMIHNVQHCPLISYSVSIKRIYNRFILQNYVTALHRSILIRFSPNINTFPIIWNSTLNIPYTSIIRFSRTNNQTCVMVKYIPLMWFSWYGNISWSFRLVSWVWCNHRNEL